MNHRRWYPRICLPPQPAFRVRRARPAEAYILARFRLLENQEQRRALGKPAFPDSPQQMGTLAKWIQQKMRERRLAGFLAVGRDGAPVAGCFIWLQEVPPRPYKAGRFVPRLQAMYTTPDWRRKGVASAVVEAALGWAKSRGGERVMLRSSVMGEKLYESKGFVRVPEMERDLRRQ